MTLVAVLTAVSDASVGTIKEQNGNNMRCEGLLRVAYSVEGVEVRMSEIERELVPKLNVAGSIPVSRSNLLTSMPER